MKIGIAGAGGIGSNVARHLAQAGVTNLLLVDFDVVETANLDRQFYFTDQAGRPKVECLKQNLLGIHPTMNIQTLTHFIRPGESARIFKNCSLVVEGFDNPTTKKLLMEELAPLGIPVVSASGIAGTDMENIRTRKIGTCHIVGDFSTDVANAPLSAPKIAVIAAMMADIALKSQKPLLPEGIYGILGEAFSLGRSNVEMAKLLVDSGIDILQYREKTGTKDRKTMLEECRLIRKITADAGVPFIVNDFLDIAMMTRADGVHIGQEDLPVAAVKKLAPRLLVGCSTHSPAQAARAVADGADYIGVGPIFATKTKEDVCDAVGLA
ncbi:MAG: sulfur carrier protein ThiS adenylyltransferase ThiF, partial [Desulfobacteraceae bacterium]|nr:sulfur carrier protein ThiS adenylyltransferase ThiF [Desulfobacteraceae bacterium]